MKDVKKLLIFGLIAVAAIGAISVSLSVFNAKEGVKIFESTPPAIQASTQDFSVLIFSKTNGFRHSDAIKEANKAFAEMGKKNSWFTFATENGAVFNLEQLALFDLVVWNNVTGEVLSDDQRDAFRVYIENGGGFVGIHGSGDFSHSWNWYENKLICASYSHHTMNPQIQEGTMHRECVSKSFPFCAQLPDPWIRTEEWYVFFENPRENGVTVLYSLDGNSINPDGNYPLLAKDKDWGMGEDHPIVWYKNVNKGRSFYSALGHEGSAFKEPHHLRLLEAGIKWAGRFEGDDDDFSYSAN